MKKIFKKIFVVIIAICGVSIIGGVNALTLEEYESLDPDNKLSAPYLVSFNGSTISTSVDGTDYKLYYQWIKIDEANKNKYDDIIEQKNKIEDDLSDYLDSVTDEQKKTEEYKNKIDEYRTQIDNLDSQLFSLIPNYNDNNWKETTDGKVYLPSEETYALWLKLVESDNITSYDVGFYSYDSTSGSGNSSSSSSTTSSNQNYSELKDNNKSQNAETIQTTTNPSTGFENYIAYVVVSVIMLGSGIVYIKNKKFIINK